MKLTLKILSFLFLPIFFLNLFLSISVTSEINFSNNLKYYAAGSGLEVDYDPECLSYESPLAKIYCNNPEKLLPAWRWSNFPLSSPVQGGIIELIKTLVTSSVYNNIANLFFSISALIWGGILLFIKYSLSSNIISVFANTIDNGFLTISKIFFGEDLSSYDGLIMLTIAIFLFVLSKKVLAGRGGAFRMITYFSVPVIFLYGMSITVQDTASSRDVSSLKDTGNFCETLTTGTPSWIGCIGIKSVDQVISIIGKGPSTIVSVSAAPTSRGDKEGKFTCSKYNAVLYNAFDEISKGRGDSILSMNSKEGNASSGVAIASLLWQRSWLTSWEGANFGTSSPRVSEATCHYLEHANEIVPKEQAYISQTAYGSSKFSFTREEFYSKLGKNVYDGAPIFPWIACQGNETDITQRSWEKLWEAKGVNSNNCNTWIYGNWTSEIQDGENWDFLNWDNLDEVRSDKLKAIKNLSPAGGVRSTDITNATEVMTTYRNDRPINRIMLGFGALISSLLSGFFLGLIAFGAFVAQVGLVLLLIMLPVTLMLIAMPLGKSGAPTGIGMKLFKLTLGFMTSKLVLTIALILTIQVSMIVTNLIYGVGN